jgi:peroxin-6
VTSADVGAAVKWSEKRTASAIGTPSVPAVRWDDIGGLEDVKAAIRDIIELPLKRKDLFGGGGGGGGS